MNRRAFLIVLDSVGIGGAPDAAAFGDGGANTLRHIMETCTTSKAEEGRTGPLSIPNLRALGVYEAIQVANDEPVEGAPDALWGAATEISPGKDTPTGHWELSGIPVPWDWTFFPDTTPAFDPDLIQQVCAMAGTDGVLGNCHASGTQIIDQFGDVHMRTGQPICYTSADSVFQIAAHEDSFGLDRLLTLCSNLAPLLHEMKVGRVIARPFIGVPGQFKRTTNRKDFAHPLPSAGLMDWAQADGREVLAVGKISDIFSGSGISQSFKGADLALVDHLDGLIETAPDGSLTFVNLVEFDALYGHRRDVSGYARHLEWFDSRLGRMKDRLRAGDLMLLVADHGNDPTWTGTDHTRERVPVLGLGVGPRAIGQVNFVDVAASIAGYLGLSETGPGKSFL